MLTFWRFGSIVAIMRYPREHLHGGARGADKLRACPNLDAAVLTIFIWEKTWVLDLDTIYLLITKQDIYRSVRKHSVKGAIDKLIRLGWMQQEGDCYRLGDPA